MDILLTPDQLSLSGALKRFVIHTNEETTFSLKDERDSKVIVQHTYTPNKNGHIEIELENIITPLLSFQLLDKTQPYKQPNILKQFNASITEHNTNENKTFSFEVIRAGIDQFADSAKNFLKTNFLTWQPNIKPVTYHTPEFLTYYAAHDVAVQGVAYIPQEETDNYTQLPFQLALLSAGNVWTIPVSYAIIAGKIKKMPAYYDIFIEDQQGNRLTYIQRYYATDIKSEEEQWILFENSLGGIDTFRAYGETENNAKHTHNIVEIENNTQEYRVDTLREFKKNTGFLTKNERKWVLDFFPSLGKYIYTGDAIRKIVVTDSDVSWKTKELPSTYNFTYRFADAKPFLNLPRTELPTEMLHIKIPDATSFTLAPRLVELPRLTLTKGALFPVQNPYASQWNVTTLEAIIDFLKKTITNSYQGDGSLGHTHDNISVLNALERLGKYLTIDAEKIYAGHADTATVADELDQKSKDWDKILQSDKASTAKEIISFLKGITIGAGFHINEQGEALLKALTVDAIKSKDFTQGADTLDGKGFAIYQDNNGRTHAVADIIEARVKSISAEVEIKKFSFASGDTGYTFAGAKITKVKKLSSGDFRCYFPAQDGDIESINDFQLGDQAMARTDTFLNHQKQRSDRRYYWRLVVNIGQETLEDGRSYHFVDLSSVKGTVALMEHTCIGCDTTVDNDEPEPLDNIVQLGNQINPDRQYAYIIYVSEGRRVDYAGINDFNLDTHIVEEHSREKTILRSDRVEIVSAAGTAQNTPLVCERGEWRNGEKYGRYDRVSHNNATWLCNVPKGTTTTTEPKDNNTEWIKQTYGMKGEASYTYIRYSNDKKTFTQPKEWKETGNYADGRNLMPESYKKFNRPEEIFTIPYLQTCKQGQKIDLTVSFDYHIPDNFEQGRIGIEFYFQLHGKDYYYGHWANKKGDGRTSKTLQILYGKNNAAGVFNQLFDKAQQRINEAYITNIKIELGNSTTTWTPAPEDQERGTTTGKFLGTLVWNKPYPSPFLEDYTWTEVEPRGINSVKRMFGVSATPNTPPTEYTETTPKLTNNNKYLWAYDIITYTDGTTTETIHAIISVYGTDGHDGTDAVNIQLSTEYIIIDTADNGTVTPAQLAQAYTDVRAFRGTTPLPITIPAESLTTSQGISATAQGERVKIVAVDNDPETGYAYASGWVDIPVKVEGRTFPLRVFVGTNLHRQVAKWVQNSRQFRSEFSTLKNDYNANRKTWNTQIQQNAQAIAQKVEQTVYQADNAETSRKMAKLETQADRISAKLSETKEKQYNLLRNTKTLRGDNIIRQGITLQERAISDFSVATALNSEEQQRDILKWNNIPIKPNTYYSLSFYAKGSGTCACALSPDTCAEVINAQDFRNSASDGHNRFTLTDRWTRCWATFKTKDNCPSTTEVIPLRLNSVATASIYGICLVESAAPTDWLPYHHDPQKNLVQKPLAISAQKVNLEEDTTTENEKYGKIRKITNNSYWYQLQWNLEEPTDNTNQQFTLFIVAKDLTGNSLWRLGTWMPGDKGSFSYLTEKSQYIELGNGWKKYYTTFYGKEQLKGTGEIFGINGLHGSLEVYAVGVVQGDECPEWNVFPIEKALLDTGIDITNGQIRQIADHFEWIDNQGNPIAQFKNGKAYFYGDISARTFSTPNGTFQVDEQGNITAINMEAVGGTFSNVIIKGSFSSPYATVEEHYNISLHDNAWLDGENTQWNHFDLQWDVSQRGRTLHITNYPLRGAYTGYGVIIAPQGKYFFDQGRRFSKIAIYTGTSVVLHGIGSEDTFYGWLVEQRNLIGNYMAGVPFRVLAWGFVTCNPTETTINAQTCNGYALAIERIGQGHCRILLPVPWAQALLKYGPQLHKTIGVSLTGFGHSYDDSTQSMPVKATIKSIGMIGQRIAIDIWLSDDDRVHDGAFQFIIYNMAFNNMFQTSENI